MFYLSLMATIKQRSFLDAQKITRKDSKPTTTQNTKISWEWWWAPIIPATQKAEAGDLLVPGRQRLQ